MKSFLLHVFAFCVLISGLLFVITQITDRGLRRSNYAGFKVWNDIRNGAINADVLIQGSSHSWVQIDPHILDTALHANSYNIGMDGYSFDVQYARYKMYQQYNKKPKLIVQVLDYFVFNRTTSLFDKYQFLPYLDNGYINDAVTQVGMSAYYHYFPFLKYQENPIYVKVGVNEFLNIEHWPLTVYKGFQGQDKHWDQSQFDNFLQDNKYITPELSDNTLNDLYEFLNSCRKEDIKVVFVFTPHYYQFSRIVACRSRYMRFLRDIANKYGASFLDFTNDSICYHKDYYYNGTHLNKWGATVFSLKLADSLKAMYK
jgi:hypothetical protein